MLSQNFAQRILELQVNFEETKNIQSIRALNQLYGAGIDYYIDFQPKKARLLQKKMTRMLSRTSVLEILQLDTLINKGVESTENAENLNKQLKTEMVKFHEDAETKILDLMKQSQNCWKKIQRLKNKDLNRQDEKLNDRLLMRAKSQEKIKRFKSLNRFNVKGDHD